MSIYTVYMFYLSCIHNFLGLVADDLDSGCLLIKITKATVDHYSYCFRGNRN